MDRNVLTKTHIRIPLAPLKGISLIGSSGIGYILFSSGHKFTGSIMFALGLAIATSVGQEIKETKDSL